MDLNIFIKISDVIWRVTLNKAPIKNFPFQHFPCRVDPYLVWLKLYWLWSSLKKTYENILPLPPLKKLKKNSEIRIAISSTRQYWLLKICKVWRECRRYSTRHLINIPISETVVLGFPLYSYTMWHFRRWAPEMIFWWYLKNRWV